MLLNHLFSIYQTGLNMTMHFMALSISNMCPLKAKRLCNSLLYFELLKLCLAYYAHTQIPTSFNTQNNKPYFYFPIFSVTFWREIRCSKILMEFSLFIVLHLNHCFYVLLWRTRKSYLSMNNSPIIFFELHHNFLDSVYLGQKLLFMISWWQYCR